MSESVKNARGVERVLRAMDTSDGAGVSLRRSIGTPQLDMLDPFLMLDSLSTDNPDEYIAGFPEHPHRGFETVTYMVEGAMRDPASLNKPSTPAIGDGFMIGDMPGMDVICSQRGILAQARHLQALRKRRRGWRGVLPELRECIGGS